MASRKNKESQSKMFRDEMYRHWKEGDQSLEFDKWYEDKMNRLILTYRKKRLNGDVVK